MKNYNYDLDIYCSQCHKKIKFGEEYDWLTTDGDCIHEKCKKDWNVFCEKIDNMSNLEFTAWLLGGEICDISN